jgi:hypothetical protein
MNTNRRTEMSERKPSKIDKVKWALYRTVAEAKPEKLAKAKWVIYTAVGISSVVFFGCDKPSPKYPPAAGD